MELKIQGHGQAGEISGFDVANGARVSIELKAEDVLIKTISLADGKLAITLEGRFTQARLQPLAAEAKSVLSGEISLPAIEVKSAEPAVAEDASPQATAPAAGEAAIAEMTATTGGLAKRHGELDADIEALPWQAPLNLDDSQPATTEEEKSEEPSPELLPASLSSPEALSPSEDEKREEMRERTREAGLGQILPRLAEANMATEKDAGQVAIRYQCPKCGTPGMQPPERLGAIVTCNKCGKAMRLTMKR